MIKSPSELYLEIYIHDIYERSSLKNYLEMLKIKGLKFIKLISKARKKI